MKRVHTQVTPETSKKVFGYTFKKDKMKTGVDHQHMDFISVAGWI